MSYIANRIPGSRKCVRALRVAVLLVVALIIPSVSTLADNAACLECHATKDIFEDLGARADSMVVTETHLGASVHAGFDCANCHADLADVTDFPHAEKLGKVNCGACHESEASVYQWHGRLQVGVGEDIPSCQSCHGSHDILPSSDRHSSVNPINMPKTCGTCHENLDLVKKHHIPLEPVYTGKMMYGLFDLIQQGYFPAGSRIVAVHTGGLQGNAGFSERLGINV